MQVEALKHVESSSLCVPLRRHAWKAGVPPDLPQIAHEPSCLSLSAIGSVSKHEIAEVPARFSAVVAEKAAFPVDGLVFSQPRIS